MSYEESTIICDWCDGFVMNREDIACKTCHEFLEQKIQDMEKKIEYLSYVIEGLEDEVKIFKATK